MENEMYQVSFTVKFYEGQIVYIHTEPDQQQWMVTGYVKRNKVLFYLLSKGLTTVEFTESEISEHKNVVNY